MHAPRDYWELIEAGFDPLEALAESYHRPRPSSLRTVLVLWTIAMLYLCS
jgi:hypothetical protein